MSGNHIINRKIFNIAYGNEEKAHQLQNRVSDLAKIRLAQALNEILDKYDNPEITLYLDQIELNLGSIPEVDLENKIIEKTKTALDEILAARIKEIKSGKGKSEDSYRTSGIKQLELLQWFLTKGTLPWWYDRSRIKSIAEIIDDTMHTQAVQVVDMIQKNGGKIHFIQRLVRNFSDTQLETIVRHLRPNEAVTIIETRNNLIDINQKKPLGGSTNEKFNIKVWEFIFEYLLNNRGTLFNTKVFVNQLLVNLAHHFNTDFLNFIERVFTIVDQLKNKVQLPTELVSIIKEIYQGNTAIQPKLENELTEQDLEWLTRKVEGNLLELSKKESNRLAKLVRTNKLEKHPELRAAILTQFRSKKGRAIAKKYGLNPGQDKTQQNNRPEHANLKALLDYLRKGSLSAEYTQITQKNLQQTLLECFTNQSNILYDFIHKYGKKESVRNRLLTSLTEPQTAKLIQFISPENFATIRVFANNIDQLITYPKVKAKTTATQLKRIKWSFILTAMLVDKGSLFNLKSFIKATLSRLAKYLGISYHDLVKQTLSQLKTQENSSKTGLATALIELEQEKALELNKQEEKRSKKERISAALNWMEYILTYAETPWWGKKNGLEISDLSSIIKTLTAAKQKKLRALFLLHFKKSESRNYFLTHLKEDGALELMKNIAPTKFSQIQFYANVLDELRPSSSAAVANSAFQFQKWNIILFELITDRGSLFNYKSFMLRTLNQLAHHFNTSFDQLLNDLFIFSAQLNRNDAIAFKTTVAELKKEYTEISTDANSIATSNQEWEKIALETNEEYKNLFYLLNALKVDLKWSFTKTQALKNWLISGQAVPFAVLQKFFRRLQFEQAELFFLFRQFNTVDQEKIIRSILNNDTLFIHYYLIDLKIIISKLKDLSHLNLNQIIQAFSLAYLFHIKTPEKHAYFAQLYPILIEYLGLPKEKADKKISSLVEHLKPHFSSTLPLSFTKLSPPKEEKAIKTNDTPLQTGTEVEKGYKTFEDEAPEYLGESVLVSNAGLVILWPFLIRYFDMLKLTKDEHFINEGATLKAIHLLQYLATGKENHPEHELYLNKLICGVLPNTPLDMKLSLTATEKETSESLLSGVIGNWPIIHDTSIEGLRETFLMRDGTIRFREDAVELRVENKTVDILLDSLPWGYSMVKLPWMKLPIHVIWR